MPFCSLPDLLFHPPLPILLPQASLSALLCLPMHDLFSSILNHVTVLHVPQLDTSFKQHTLLPTRSFSVLCSIYKKSFWLL